MNTGMHPGDMLPDEMWEELISHLINPMDKISLVKSHPWLQDGYYSKVNEWHFLTILPIILDKLEATKSLNEFQSEVLNWRMISPSCRCLIDEFLYSHPDFYCDFESRSKVERFMKEFSPPGSYSSSLIMKKFSGVCKVPNSGNNPTSEEMTGLLRKIGLHLTWLDLDIHLQDAGRAGIMTAELMSLVPNVEGFLLRFTLPLPNEAGTEPFVFSDIPVLPNLEVLYTELNYTRNPNQPPLNLPVTIPWPDLSKTFPNLLSLCLSVPLWKDEYNQAGLFPKLQSLTLLLSHLDMQKAEEKLFKLFWNLHVPKIKTLKLEYDSTIPDVKSQYFISRLIPIAIRSNRLVKLCVSQE